MAESPESPRARAASILTPGGSPRTIGADLWDDVKCKFVVVTGGIMSGIGKGVTASSVGVVLKSCGLNVTSIKIDPYLNIDAGTMSPFEHGEVFVLNDGGEADLDLGNYERFIDLQLTRDHNITTGKIYQRAIQRERQGDYLGKTVLVVPHVTDTIQTWIRDIAEKPTNGVPATPDVCVIELGGTIGDMESMPFVEALRQMQMVLGPQRFFHIHVSLVPIMSGELKTKPTQHSVRDVRAAGLHPSAIACRCKEYVHEAARSKIAQFCQVPTSAVISVHDVANMYFVPGNLLRGGLLQVMQRQLQLHDVQCDLTSWNAIAQALEDTTKLTTSVRICIVGKYTGLQDSYLSVIRALQHAAIAQKQRLEIVWVEAEKLERREEADPAAYDNAWESVRSCHGILVPGGFGDRGFEGKILVSKYARENRVPYLGICLGMHAAVVDAARHAAGLEGANSEEFDKSAAHHVLVYMPEISRTHMGGTMRLGLHTTRIVEDGSLAERLYGSREIHERHRHRYEVNTQYKEQLERAGLRFVGCDSTHKRMEIVELAQEAHPFFFAVQYHPEFLSRPNRPSAPFLGLMRAACGEDVAPSL